eukprot:5371480-Amphidinium_carterae.1
MTAKPDVVMPLLDYTAAHVGVYEKLAVVLHPHIRNDIVETLGITTIAVVSAEEEEISLQLATIFNRRRIAVERAVDGVVSGRTT